MTPPRVLGIDTAAARGGVALLSGETVRCRDLGEQGRHAEEVLPALHTLLQEAGLGCGEIDLLAVNVGPGSFTGIRVGIATALGLSEAGGVPVAGLGCLDIQARACYDATSPQIGAYIVSAADVRRGEVVRGRFRVVQRGVVREEEDVLVPLSDPGTEPPSGTRLAGDAARILWPDAREVVRWIPSGPERAAATARLGRMAWQAEAIEPPVPRYARGADARPRRK
jgi:tRNA threonylcarbamoyladenosine biosynthesis protein TsaB